MKHPESADSVRSDPAESPLDGAAEQIARWITEQVYSMDPVELASTEPRPLFAVEATE
jgi:hypothetical protein